jgi:hypothetical protein
MTSEQLGQLGAAIGRVDPVAAATVAAEIAAGITVRTVQEAGKIIGVGKANNYINQRIKALPKVKLKF